MVVRWTVWVHYCAVRASWAVLLVAVCCGCASLAVSGDPRVGGERGGGLPGEAKAGGGEESRCWRGWGREWRREG